MKKIIDEHGRVFGKISIIDLFVILIVLVAAAALYVKFNVLDVPTASSETGEVTYTVTVYGIRDYSVDAMKTGDALYDKNNSGGYPVGTITDIQTAESMKLTELVDGTVVLGRKIGYKDVTLTVTANGAESEGRFLVNRTYELNANSVRTFQTKFCTFEATITSIDSITEAA